MASNQKELFNRGDRAYYKSPDGTYSRVTVTTKQLNSKSKKIEILKNGSKVDALVKNLLSVSAYEELQNTLEARADEIRLRDGIIAKEEREQAYLSQFVENVEPTEPTKPDATPEEAIIDRIVGTDTIDPAIREIIADAIPVDSLLQVISEISTPETAPEVQNEEAPAKGELVAFTSPESFAQAIADAPHLGAVSKLCNRLLDLPMFKGISDNTKMQRLAPYNKAVKALPIELVRDSNAVLHVKPDGSQELRHFYFKYIGVLDHDWKANRKNSAEKIISKLDNQAVAIDGLQFTETLKNCLARGEVYQVLAGLIAASGRRPIEVIYTGVFELPDSDPHGFSNVLTFSGQAKKRSAETESYEIYLLGCTASQYLTKLELVRNDWIVKNRIASTDPDDSDLLKKLSDPIRIQTNRVIADKFSWLPAREGEAGPTCKTLRAVWVAVAADRYCPTTTNKLLFASRLLGHFDGDPNSMQVTLSYADCTVTKSDPSPAQVPDFDAEETAGEAMIAESEIAPQNPKPELEMAIENTIEELLEIAEEEAIDTAETVLPDYLQAVAEQSGQRHALDFYETPPWLSLLALKYAPLSGTVGEPCCGYSAMSAIMRSAGLNVWTNDIDSQKTADSHHDATDPVSWQIMPAADWIVSNPPYGKSGSKIVINAFEKAKKGVVMVLRLNWLEVCDDRVQFLKDHPPTMIVNVPRYCYRKGTAEDKWATDLCPTNLYIWDKSHTHGMTRIVSLSAADIPLFHRTPEGIPDRPTIEAEVYRITKEKQQPIAEIAESETANPPAKKLTRKEQNKPAKKTPQEKIEATIWSFLEKNKALPISERWFVSQNIIAAVAGVGNNAANQWLREHRPTLDKHNEGLNCSTQNRGRAFMAL